MEIEKIGVAKARFDNEDDFWSSLLRDILPEDAVAALRDAIQNDPEWAIDYFGDEFEQGMVMGDETCEICGDRFEAGEAMYSVNGMVGVHKHCAEDEIGSEDEDED